MGIQDSCHDTGSTKDPYDNIIVSQLRVAQEPSRNRKPEPSEYRFSKNESGTGTAGPVFSQGPKLDSGTGTVCLCQTMLKGRKKKNPLTRGTAGTENRNRSNRPTLQEF